MPLMWGGLIVTFLLILYQFWGRFNLASAKRAGPGWLLGPWPVDPAHVAVAREDATVEGGGTTLTTGHGSVNGVQASVYFAPTPILSCSPDSSGSNAPSHTSRGRRGSELAKGEAVRKRRRHTSPTHSVAATDTISGWIAPNRSAGSAEGSVWIPRMLLSRGKAPQSVGTPRPATRDTDL